MDTSRTVICGSRLAKACLRRISRSKLIGILVLLWGANGVAFSQVQGEGGLEGGLVGGGGTTGGGGGGPQEDPNFSQLTGRAKVVDIEEVALAKSAYPGGTSLTRHVARAKIRLQEEITGSPSAGPGQPPPPAGAQNRVYIDGVKVTSPGEVGWLSTQTPSITSSTNPLGPWVRLGRYQNQPIQPWYMYIQVGASSSEITSPTFSQATLNGGQFLMTVDIISVYWSFQGGQWGEIYQTYSENINLDFARLNMDVVSMDSRKTYGQPSLDGELPGDPNADLRHPSFLNWTYKGGLFAGNLDPTNDLSGQSRIQAYVTGTWPTSTYKAGCITIYPMEKAPLQNSLSMTLGFRAPAANDPNLNDTIGQMFWDHKWDLGNITPNDVSHPKDVMISDGNRNNYLNVPFLFGSGDAWPRVAMVNISPASGPSWQYFCSKWYGQMNVQVGFPRYDAHPRIWRLGQIPVGG